MLSMCPRLRLLQVITKYEIDLKIKRNALKLQVKPISAAGIFLEKNNQCFQHIQRYF